MVSHWDTMGFRSFSRYIMRNTRHDKVLLCGGAIQTLHIKISSSHAASVYSLEKSAFP
jgi:hypothetical protein